MAGASPATSPSHAGAQAKNSHFRQGSFADGKGLTGNKPIPGRNASKKSHCRQGSFADGKGLTGNEPVPGRAPAKIPFQAEVVCRIPFQARVVCRGQAGPGADKFFVYFLRNRSVFGNLWGGHRSSPQKLKMQGNQSPQGQNERK